MASAPNAASMAAVESGDAVEGDVEEEEETARPFDARHAFTATMNLSWSGKSSAASLLFANSI